MSKKAHSLFLKRANHFERMGRKALGLRQYNCYDCQVAGKSVIAFPSALSRTGAFNFAGKERDNQLVLQKLNYWIRLIAAYGRGIYQHSVNVSEIAAKIAIHLKLPERQVCLIKNAGLFHDLGKTKIAKEIINKPGKLTSDEWIVVKKHPEFGVDILSSHFWSTPFLQAVHYHHERWDGKGYYGIKGHDIPLEARILALADAFDAMTSSRVYQKIRRWEESLEEIDRCSGTQFDPYLVQKIFQCPDKILKPGVFLQDGDVGFGTRQLERPWEKGTDYY